MPIARLPAGAHGYPDRMDDNEATADPVSWYAIERGWRVMTLDGVSRRLGRRGAERRGARHLPRPLRARRDRTPPARGARRISSRRSRRAPSPSRSSRTRSARSRTPTENDALILVAWTRPPHRRRSKRSSPPRRPRIERRSPAGGIRRDAGRCAPRSTSARARIASGTASSPARSTSRAPCSSGASRRTATGATRTSAGVEREVIVLCDHGYSTIFADGDARRSRLHARRAT